MSSPPDLQPEPSVRAAPVAPSLGQRAFGGAIWTLGQTVGSKLAAIAAQLVLAALLSKQDFGRLAEVILIVSLAGLGQQLGIGEILIRRHRHFQKWAEIAFWINLAAGLVGAGFVALLAPFAHLFFQDVHAAGGEGIHLFRNLLLVAAIGLPFDALTVVTQAKLRIDLRFRTLALIGTGNVVGTALLSVAFASTRLLWPTSPVGGAMALVLPRPLISAAVMAVSLALSGFRLNMRPGFRRWIFVLRDSRYFFFTSFFNTLLMQGDYLITGLLFSTDQLGAYYFAFTLSTQTVQLVSANLTSVLLPSFAKLDQEPIRQTAAYVRVCSLVSMVGSIVCVVQALTVGPLLHVFFKGKWDEAIQLFQILTVGMMFVLPSSPALSLMQAQGKYFRILIWTIVVSTSFVLSVLIGAASKTTTGIAVADSVFYAIFGPLGVAIAMTEKRKAIRLALNRIYLFPLVMAIIAALAAIGSIQLLAGMSDLMKATAGASVAILVYGCGCLAWRSADVSELVQRIRPLLARLFPSKSHAENVTE